MGANEENRPMQEDTMGNPLDDKESQLLHLGQKDHTVQAQGGTPCLQREGSAVVQCLMDNKEKDKHVSKTTIVKETPQFLASAKTDSKPDETENDDDDDEMSCEGMQLLVTKKIMLNDKGEKGSIKKKK